MNETQSSEATEVEMSDFVMPGMPGMPGGTSGSAGTISRQKRKTAAKKATVKKVPKNGRRKRKAGGRTKTVAKTAPKNGRRKKKKVGRPAAKKKTGARRGRKPSPVTQEKQQYVFELLERDSELSMNRISKEITRRFGTMLAHPKLKDAYDAFRSGRKFEGATGPITRSKKKSKRGPGRRALDSAASRVFGTLNELPAYFVAVKQGDKVSVMPFRSEREANTYMQSLIVDRGIGLADISFYAAFEPTIAINIKLAGA